MKKYVQCTVMLNETIVHDLGFMETTKNSVMLITDVLY